MIRENPFSLVRNLKPPSIIVKGYLNVQDVGKQ